VLLIVLLVAIVLTRTGTNGKPRLVKGRGFWCRVFICWKQHRKRKENGINACVVELAGSKNQKITREKMLKRFYSLSVQSLHALAPRNE
jgi:hypothetical protein